MDIRRTLRIRQNEPLEIFTDRKGEVILKKYSPIGELGQFADGYAQILHQSMGHIACITDKDVIIAVAGTTTKQLLNKRIGEKVEKVMSERKVLVFTEPFSLIDEDGISYPSAVIAPILSDGDVIGTVILASGDPAIAMGQLEQKMVETAANFLSKQIE